MSATQAGADSGGTTSKVADGEYLYTFKTKAVGLNGGSWDPTVTHRLGAYGSRNLTEFDLGTNYDSNTMTWIPGGGVPTNTRDVVRTATCNKCHDSLAFHGGSRKGVDLCIMCHTPQTTDPDTGSAPVPVLAVVGRRLRHLVGLVESMTFGSVTQRLARLLLDASKEAGAATFDLPVTHQEIASRLGTVREVVSRNLSRFRADGLIRVDGRQVQIVDRARLEQEAEPQG